MAMRVAHMPGGDAFCIDLAILTGFRAESFGVRDGLGVS